MRLDLKCKSDDFERFKAGEYKAVVVEGKRSSYQGTSAVNLRDILVVTNCNDSPRLLFEVEKVIAYWGAATLDTALQNVKSRLGPESLYLAPNERNGLLPMLHEGVYAIMIRPYERKPRKR